MPNLRKIIIYVVALTVVLWAVGWCIKRVKPVYAKWRLNRALAQIEPWPATTNYSARAWAKLIKAARVFQKTDPELGGNVLSEHMKKYTGQPAQFAVEEGKLFLLLHTVFEIAEDGTELVAAPGQQVVTGPDAVRSSASPVRWQNGQPRLISGYPNMPLFRQPIGDQYTQLRYRYKYRDLSKVKF